MANETLKKLVGEKYTIQETEEDNVYIVFRNDGKSMTDVELVTRSEILELYQKIRAYIDPEIDEKNLTLHFEDLDDSKSKAKLKVEYGVRIEPVSDLFVKN